MTQTELNFERCDIHYLYRRISRENPIKIGKFERAMKIAKGMCHRKLETKRQAIKAWADEIRIALK